MIKRRVLIRLLALAAVLSATFSGVGTARANSSGWTIVPSSNFGTYDILQAVAAVSSSDVWAAGHYNNGSNNQTLIEHWNGLFWQTVTSPNEGSGDNFLYGLASVSANDVWAVAYYGDSSSDVRTLTEHWNGAAWSIVSSPNQPGVISNLAAVSAVSTDDVWAVGYSLSISTSSYQTLIEHWDGKGWGIVSSPNRGSQDNFLRGVSSVSSTKAEAAGSYVDSSGFKQTLTEVWNGSGWQVTASGNVLGSGFQGEDNDLYGVAASSTGTPTAVGAAGTRTLIEQCCLSNSWYVVSGPAAGTSSELTAAAYDPSGDVWAVGDEGSGGAANTLVEEQTGSGFQIMASPNEGTLKLVGFAHSLAKMQSPLTSTPTGTPQTAGLPALRSGGISLARTGWATDLTAAFATSTANNSQVEGNSAPALYAEDLVRGYRPDIFDSTTNHWYSLTRRSGVYTFPNAPSSAKQLFTIEDEGLISLAVTQDSSTPPFDGALPDGSPQDMYLHEIMFRWHGWSLAAHMPGKVLPDGVPPDLANTPVTQDNPPVFFPLRVDFTAKPRSLPRLRFGRGYRLRVRTVDLAGNSLPYNSTQAAYAAPSFSSAPLVYRRFEPVPAPAIVPHDDLTNRNGESTNHLVVRSDLNTLGDAYVSCLNSLQPQPPPRPFVANSQRHIVPPQASTQLAKTHGMFDLSRGPNVVDPNAYNNIQGSNIVFADTNPGGGTGSLDNALPDLITADQATLPYLPDPISRGAAFYGMPGQPATAVILQSFNNFNGTAQWPFLEPFRLQLVDIPFAPNDPTAVSQVLSFDATNRVLTVNIVQGETCDLTLSSFLNAPDVQLMGMWDWVSQYLGPGAKLTTLQNLARRGALWWLTPFLDLRLVHAVQRPLVQPVFNVLKAAKQGVGQTYAVLENFDANSSFTPMPISGNSTMKLDVLATWTDKVNDVNSPTGFDLASGSAYACEIPVLVTDTVVDFPNLSIDGARVPFPRHEFGDTKYRSVTYTAVATTRFQEYFPITDAQIAAGQSPPYTQTSPAVTVDVPNSNRPDTPNLLYAIPAFDWSTSNSSGQVQRQRKGGKVRVYMNPPWYSSGDGELLGVVLVSPNTSAELKTERAKLLSWSRLADRMSRSSAPPRTPYTDSLKPYVSQWGMDPLWQGSGILNFPTVANFPLAVPAPAGYRQNGFSIDELPNVTVDVDGHTVSFGPEENPEDNPEADLDRKLWFSDIEFNYGGAYYPFVRLALCRYQPRSIDNAYLSRIFLADLVQLAPDRSATFQYSANSNQVVVTVTGPGFNGAPLGDYNDLQVVVEQQQPGITGDLAWVPVPNGVYQLSGGGGNPTTWQGTISLPQPPGNGSFRLIVKGSERYYHTDDSSGQKLVVHRLVYASDVTL